jgi:hypothetical protein
VMRRLFSANPARIGRFDAPPTSDAVPASLVDGTPADLKADLIALLGKQAVLHRAIDLVRYASDATDAGVGDGKANPATSIATIAATHSSPRAVESRPRRPN